jgi:hypothetical protein
MTAESHVLAILTRVRTPANNRLQRTIGTDAIRRAPLAAEPERSTDLVGDQTDSTALAVDGWRVEHGRAECHSSRSQ